MKNYNNFIKENNKFGYSYWANSPGWDDLTYDERHEIMYANSSILDKEFSDLMVKNLIDNDTAEYWSTYNAVLGELENYEEGYSTEIEYRLTDGENPKKVILSVLDKINDKSNELISEENKNS